MQQDKKTPKAESAPLAGVRIVDLTTVLMGLLATQLAHAASAYPIPRQV